MSGTSERIFLAGNPFRGFSFAESYGLGGFLGVVFVDVGLGFGAFY